mgnify:CR=1 FL=1
MRLATLSNWEKFEVCDKYRVFASNHNSFNNWNPGEKLLIFIGKEGLAETQVIGKVFNSNEVIWSNDLYEWRVPIEIFNKFDGIRGETVNSAIKSLLCQEYGHIYGFLIRNHTLLRENVADKIEGILYDQTGERL